MRAVASHWIDRRAARLAALGACLAALSMMFASPAVASTAEPLAREDATAAVTEHDVIPIMLRRCTVCHGLRRQEAELDLRSRSAMLKGGKSGPAIVPGDSAASRLIQKVRAGEMPPLRRVVEVSVKPIEPAELEIVARWIDQGAPEAARRESDPAPHSIIHDAASRLWSFRSPRAAAVPRVTNEQAANPIDAFILARLHEKNLSFAPEADRLTLLRRAHLDLTGLPPDPDVIQTYMNDSTPDAYERMIDRLLASPRYGERWGRHWLDVAGYADSEGKTDQDLRRPFAWRYRDYVIRSFNADKPYDRFLTEQIAGDELADWQTAEITPEIYDNLVATGFLRMSPDGTFANITNFVPDRLEVIADAIQVLGSAVLGLTLHCARCHDHKLDPISQHDYYRMLDIFKGAYDEHDWLKPNVSEIAAIGQWGYRLLPRVLPGERREWEETVARLDAEVAQHKTAFEQRTSELKAKVVSERLAKLPAELTGDLRRMLATPPAERDAVLKYLADKFEKSLTVELAELKKLDADFNNAADEFDKTLKQLQAKRPIEPMIHALWDRGDPSPTYVLRRGDYLKPGALVGPGVPAVVAGDVPWDVRPPWPNARSTGRRLALARWLTQPDHPLSARVMANRIWRHHFGTGLVETLGNFGTTGSRPTHPELLDWLAIEFVRQGWSIKAMHRLIMNSATYRQSSRVTSVQEQIDPDNMLYSRMPMRRVDAEVLYDSMLLAAGRLDQSRYGPPDPVSLSADGLVTPVAPAEFGRRSIYVEQRRKQIPTLLENFDLPQMNPNCIERAESNVAPQALHMLNNSTVLRLAEHFADRVRREAGAEFNDQVEHVYLVALGRPPRGDERELGLAAMAQWNDHWVRELTGRGETDTASVAARAAAHALANFCHTILNSAEFLYVD